MKIRGSDTAHYCHKQQITTTIVNNLLLTPLLACSPHSDLWLLEKWASKLFNLIQIFFVPDSEFKTSATKCPRSQVLPLIGREWLCDLDTDLWLVENDNVTWILASDWFQTSGHKRFSSHKYFSVANIFLGGDRQLPLNQSEASIQVTWSLWTNQRPAHRVLCPSENCRV